MKAPVLYTLILSLAISTVGLCQKKIEFSQLPVSTQNSFKQIASQHRTGPVDYCQIENAIKNKKLDLSKMPIEDAVMLVMELISQDATYDLQEMIKDLEATRKRRAAIRQETDLLKKQADSLRGQAKRAFNRADSLKMATAINQKQVKVQEYTTQEKELSVAENKKAASMKNTEDHLKSVKDAIQKLLQLQAESRRQ